MAAPEFFDRIIEPPRSNSSVEDIYRWLYDMWQRTGGYETYVVNLSGLEASVQELNTLVGIDTNFTVQAQLDGKLNADDAGSMALQDADNVNITGGAVAAVTIDSAAITNSSFDGDLRVNIGDSGVTATCGASLYTDANVAANTNGSENDLMSYSLAPDSLNAEGVYVDIEVWGTFAANANNKRVRVYFGSQVIFDTGAVAANAGNWYIYAKIMNSGALQQKAVANIISSNALITPTCAITALTQDETQAVTIKTTAQAVTANDVIQQGFSIKWFSAA
jgi:hypothetical protein